MGFPPAGAIILKNGDGEYVGFDMPPSEDFMYCDTCGFSHSGDCPPDGSDYFDDEDDDLDDDDDIDNYGDDDIEYEEEDPPEPDDDMGPEVDDEGGMSEVRPIGDNEDPEPPF